MRNTKSFTLGVLMASVSLALTACSSTQVVAIDPQHVKDLRFKLASKEPAFCPGEPLKIELLASMDDGTTCSSADPKTGCMGKSDALIDPNQIRIQGSAGALVRSNDDIAWVPPRDALATADRALSLRGWLEGEKALKTKLAELSLRPDYHCMEDNVFSVDTPLVPGQLGKNGPNIKVSATLISTPYLREAILARVDYPGGHTHILAPYGKKPIRIASKGQDGAPGAQGRAGANGADGRDGGNRVAEQRSGSAASSKTCRPGRHGSPGGNGGPGGQGGDGGNGGMVELVLDEAVAEKLKPFVIVESRPGKAGAGGRGGIGGLGGRGGQAATPTGEPCSGAQGQLGQNGHPGSDGNPGKPGKAGVVLAVSTRSRKVLFGEEFVVIRRLESASPTPALREAAPESPTARAQ